MQTQELNGISHINNILINYGIQDSERIYIDIDYIILFGKGKSEITSSILRNIILRYTDKPVIIASDLRIRDNVRINHKVLVIIVSFDDYINETIAFVRYAIKSNAILAGFFSDEQLSQFFIEGKHNYFDISKYETINGRTTFPLKLISLLSILTKYDCIKDTLIQELDTISDFLKEEEANLISLAMEWSNKLSSKIAVIFCSEINEGLGSYFEYQLKKKGVLIFWSEKVSEIYREIKTNMIPLDNSLAIIFLIDFEDDKYTSYASMKNAIKFGQQVNHNTISIHLKGKNRLEKVFYLIYLIDWIAFYVENKRYKIHA